MFSAQLLILNYDLFFLSREYKLERFSIKFRKTRTKEITTADQKKVKYL